MPTTWLWLGIATAVEFVAPGTTAWSNSITRHAVPAPCGDTASASATQSVPSKVRVPARLSSHARHPARGSRKTHPPFARTAIRPDIPDQSPAAPTGTR